MNQQPQASMPTQQPQAATGNPADPYAAYGGYENYVAIYYAAIAHHQAQASGQMPPGSDQQRPPGS